MCRGSQEGRMTAGLRAPTPAPRHFSGPLRSLRRVLSTVVPRGPKARGWQVADAHLRPQGQRLRFGSRRRALISLNDPRSQQEEPAKMGLLGMAKEPQLVTSIGAAKRGSARLSLLTRERESVLCCCQSPGGAEVGSGRGSHRSAVQPLTSGGQGTPTPCCVRLARVRVKGILWHHKMTA